MIVPDPLQPGAITGSKLREFLNALRDLARSGKIKVDPGSGLQSKEMGDFTALWVKLPIPLVIKLTASHGSGLYDWVEQDPIPVSPWWKDAVGPNASGMLTPVSGPPNPAIAANSSDPPYTANHIVPAMRDPVTNKVIIMAGS